MATDPVFGLLLLDDDMSNVETLYHLHYTVLAALAKKTVLDHTLNDPTGLDPAEGDMYYVPLGTDGWSGVETQLVIWVNGEWVILPDIASLGPFYSLDTNAWYYRNGEGAAPVLF